MWQWSMNIIIHICFRSLFVLLKGASKEEAFRVGREITERVTAMNPKPVKLKFEKVCILSTASQLFEYLVSLCRRTCSLSVCTEVSCPIVHYVCLIVH